MNIKQFAEHLEELQQLKSDVERKYSIYKSIIQIRKTINPWDNFHLFYIEIGQILGIDLEKQALQGFLLLSNLPTKSKIGLRDDFFIGKEDLASSKAALVQIENIIQDFKENKIKYLHEYCRFTEDIIEEDYFIIAEDEYLIRGDKNEEGLFKFTEIYFSLERNETVDTLVELNWKVRKYEYTNKRFMDPKIKSENEGKLNKVFRKYQIKFYPEYVL